MMTSDLAQQILSLIKVAQEEEASPETHDNYDSMYDRLETLIANIEKLCKEATKTENKMMTDEFARKLMGTWPATQLTRIAQSIEDHILAIASKYKYPVESTAEACRVLCASRAEPASHTLSILNAGNASLCAEFEAIYERLQNENRTNQV